MYLVGQVGMYIVHSTPYMLPNIYLVVEVCLNEASEARAPLPFSGAPTGCFACKYSSSLVKILLFAHIIFTEPHHNQALCLQKGPQQLL